MIWVVSHTLSQIVFSFGNEYSYNYHLITFNGQLEIGNGNGNGNIISNFSIGHHQNLAIPSKFGKITKICFFRWDNFWLCSQKN